MTSLTTAEESQLNVYRDLYFNNDRYTAIAEEPLLEQVYDAQAKAEIFFDDNSQQCPASLKKQFLDAVGEHMLMALAKKHGDDAMLESEDVDGIIAKMLD